MKTILDTINESKTNPRQITDYVKSWITSESDAQGYFRVLSAIWKGLDEGCRNNLKYLDSEQEQKDAQVLDRVISEWDIPDPTFKGWK